MEERGDPRNEVQLMIAQESKITIPELTKESRAVVTKELRALNALNIQHGIANASMTTETVKVWSKKLGDTVERPRRLGAHAGNMVRQLVYWDGKGEADDFSIHKTKREWEEEAGLSRSNLDTATRRLVSEGLLTARPGYRKGDRRPTTYYTLNLWAVMRLLDPVRAVEIEPELRYLEPETDACADCGYDDCLCFLDDGFAEPEESAEEGGYDLDGEQAVAVENRQRTCPEPTANVSKTDRVAVENRQLTGEYPQSTAGEEQHETRRYTPHATPFGARAGRDEINHKRENTTTPPPDDLDARRRDMLDAEGTEADSTPTPTRTSPPMSALEAWPMYKRGEMSLEEMILLTSPTGPGEGRAA